MGAIVAAKAFERFHDLDEGGLTRIKVALVSGSSLADVAQALGFADVIVFGSSETGTGKRGLHSALENVYEAIVAALYLDGGIDAAESFVERTLMGRMSLDLAREPENPKSALQEKLQETGGSRKIEYRMKSEKGPDHNKTFTVEVCVDDRVIGTGSGQSKARAEQAAAEDALSKGV